MMAHDAAPLQRFGRQDAQGPASIPSGGLEVEQRHLDVRPAGVLARRAVGTDHAMARDDNGQRIAGARGADGTHRARVADGDRHVGVCLALAVADIAQMLDDVAAEAFGQSQVDRHAWSSTS